ncbi:hypothetical protein OsI_28168 [Oryza sativa Indica Group]|uniref:Uncharacterized protein n=1 Tax=Oryza sativa subsp. indica TaxID=39946 RepID=B8BBN5_ORYSI|nr:hypothetical protein OsI_28168 [Oryza sativa Indica Group]
MLTSSLSYISAYSSPLLDRSRSVSTGAETSRASNRRYTNLPKSSGGSLSRPGPRSRRELGARMSTHGAERQVWRQRRESTQVRSTSHALQVGHDVVQERVREGAESFDGVGAAGLPLVHLLAPHPPRGVVGPPPRHLSERVVGTDRRAGPWLPRRLRPATRHRPPGGVSPGHSVERVACTNETAKKSETRSRFLCSGARDRPVARCDDRSGGDDLPEEIAGAAAEWSEALSCDLSPRLASSGGWAFPSTKK